MDEITPAHGRQLLTLLLAQRLELNAIERALESAGVITRAEIGELRQQASDTAKAWGAQEGDDLLALLRIHSSPTATMLVPGRSE